MSKIKRGRPSPAMLVAIVALVAALGGSAVAEVASTSKLSKKERQQTKKIAKKQAKKLDKKIELTPGPQGPKATQRASSGLSSTPTGASSGEAAERPRLSSSSPPTVPTRSTSARM